LLLKIFSSTREQGGRSSSMSTKAVAPPATDVALVIVQHGSHGDLSDFVNIQACLRQAWKEDLGLVDTPLEVWGTPINSGLATDHGLVHCGDKLAAAIREELAIISEKYPSANLHVSCLAHSFGGLILRQALKVLDETDALAGVKLTTFVTLACPHVGVRQLNPFLRFGAWLLAACGCSRAYADLLLKNSDIDKLCTPAALAPIARFRSRALYASAARDHLVAFETAGLALPSEAAAAASSPPCPGYVHVCEMVTLDPPNARERSLSNHSFETVEDVEGMSTRASQMLLSLRSVGRWSLYPVQFSEWHVVPHGAIIHHPSQAKNPGGGGSDVAQHVAELLCSDAAAVILLGI